MLIMIAQGESQKSENMGQCLEFLLSERIPLMLLGLAKGNNPKGLLKLGEWDLVREGHFWWKPDERYKKGWKEAVEHIK